MAKINFGGVFVIGGVVTLAGLGYCARQDNLARRALCAEMMAAQRRVLEHSAPVLPPSCASVAAKEGITIGGLPLATFVAVMN